MDADVLNFAQNMSGHSPIYCQFHTKDIGTRIEVNNNITMKPSWKKASPQQKSSYIVTLQSRLNDLKITEKRDMMFIASKVTINQQVMIS